MRIVIGLVIATLILATPELFTATLHVSLQSTNPTPPNSNWAAPATNIQDAVDAAARGCDQFLVHNKTT